MYLRHPKSDDVVDRDLGSATSNVIASLEEVDEELEPTISDGVVAGVNEKCSHLEETVRGKLKSAQQKQAAEYNARKRRGRLSVTVSVGDRVLKRNARKNTRQGGRLEPEYSGPYTIEAITSSGQVTLKNDAGRHLATCFNVSLLKPYIIATEDNTTADTGVIQQEAMNVLREDAPEESPSTSALQELAEESPSTSTPQEVAPKKRAISNQRARLSLKRHKTEGLCKIPAGKSTDGNSIKAESQRRKQ